MVIEFFQQIIGLLFCIVTLVTFFINRIAAHLKINQRIEYGNL